MEASNSTQAITASVKKAFYCEGCRKSFAGRRELSRHMKQAIAHFPSGIPCYFPGCSKRYQKSAALHIHVGRDHRIEIEALSWEMNRQKEEVKAHQQRASRNDDNSSIADTRNAVENPPAGFQQMPTNIPVPSNSMLATTYDLRPLNNYLPAFTGLQNNLHFPPYGNGQEMQAYQHGGYTIPTSLAGMSTAPSLSSHTPYISSTRINSHDHCYPMPPTSTSTYMEPPRQLFHNYDDQLTSGMEAEYSDPYMGSANMILDEDTEISHDG